MAVSGMNLMAAMSLGSTIELSTDLPAALRQHDVQPPRRISSLVPRNSRSMPPSSKR
jgi:hypothetical protein